MIWFACMYLRLIKNIKCMFLDFESQYFARWDCAMKHDRTHGRCISETKTLQWCPGSLEVCAALCRYWADYSPITAGRQRQGCALQSECIVQLFSMQCWCRGSVFQSYTLQVQCRTLRCVKDTVSSVKSAVQSVQNRASVQCDLIWRVATCDSWLKCDLG